MNVADVDKNPAAERYLAALEHSLSPMKASERMEVIHEIRAHLHDGMVAGKPLDELLNRLGAAELLAKAYLVESYLNPKRFGSGWISRTLGLFGLLVFGSLPTLVITSLLGSLGIAFLIAGPILFSSGIFGVFGVSLAPAVKTNLAPWLQMILGPIMTVAGASLLWSLLLYLRWLINLFRRVASVR